MFERAGRLVRSLAESRHRRRQIWYVPVLGIAMGLMMARLIWLAAWLPVDAFAALAFGLLLSSGFCILGALGLQPLLQRDLPGMLVRGQEFEARRLMLQACLAAAICFLVVLPITTLGPSVAAYPTEVWAAGLFHGLAQQLFMTVTTDSRSRGNPLQFSMDNLMRAALVTVISWPLAAGTGSATLVLFAEAMVSIALSAVALGRILVRDNAGLKSTVMEALSTASKLHWTNATFLLSASILTYGLLNIDRWVAGIWLSKQAFAQYAFIAIGLMIAQSFQSLLNAALFPLVARRHATKGKEATFRIARNLSFASLALGAAFGPIVVVGSQHLVNAWLPQYAPSLSVAWPICAIAVLRLSDFFSTYLVVSGYERTLTCVNLLILALASTVPFWPAWQALAVQQDPLKAIAALAVGVAGVHYLAVSGASWYRCRPSPPK